MAIFFCDVLLNLFHHISLASTSSHYELLGCLKSWGLSLTKGHSIYCMSLMFWWQEWDIVTILSFSVWSVVAMRPSNTVQGEKCGPSYRDRHKSEEYRKCMQNICRLHGKTSKYRLLFSTFSAQLQLTPALCCIQQKCSNNSSNYFFHTTMQNVWASTAECSMFTAVDSDSQCLFQFRPISNFISTFPPDHTLGIFRCEYKSQKLHIQYTPSTLPTLTLTSK